MPLVLLLVLAMLLAFLPLPTRKPKPVEATLPADYAAYLSTLAVRVHVLRRKRGEPSRQPGVGPMSAAYGAAFARGPYPTEPDERRLLEDLLTVLEHDPARSEEARAIRAHMMAHYATGEPGGLHA